MDEKQSVNNPKNWKYNSPEGPGFYTIVSPENSACKVTWCFRLNLEKDSTYTLKHESLEQSAVIIKGKIDLTFNGKTEQLEKLDSFYLPAGKSVDLLATKDLILYIGGGPFEGVGEFFIRKFDLSIPIGDIHQIHGEPPYQRTVFMTVNQEVPASRLITGVTWGEEGKWTSWPPHQHTKDLEEVYFYFDLPAPKFALHLASTKPGVIDAIHPVSSGDCIAIPEGYHPTVGMPGMKSCYFWVMSAHTQKSRRYDLAINDPNFQS